VNDVVEDRQMREIGAVVPFEDGSGLTVNNPINVAGIEKRTPRRPPALGEHSDAILREAGYDDAGIAALRATGIVA